MKREEELIDLMTTLDDAWNAGPASPLWETFKKRHTENVAVYWPGGAPPTRGRHNHDVEAIEFFKTFRTTTSSTAPTRSSSPTATTRVLWRNSPAR